MVKIFRINGIILLLVSIIALRAFIAMQTHTIQQWDELTNITVVDALIGENSSWQLTYNDQPFFEKPPLWYYIAGVFAKLTGNTLLGCRLVSVIAVIIIAVTQAIFLKKYYGIIASIMGMLIILTLNQLWITNIGGVFATHTTTSADLDMLMMLMMNITTIQITKILVLPMQTSMKNKLLSIASIAIPTALGILTKSPIALVPILSTIPYAILNKCQRHKLYHIFIPSIGIALVPALFWFLIMIYNYGTNFYQNFLSYHIFTRVVTPIEGHNEPIWWYMYLFLNPLFNPWSIFFIVSLIASWSGFANQKTTRHEHYFLIQILLILLIITATQTKLSWYLLPIYIPTTLWISSWTQRIIIWYTLSIGRIRKNRSR